MTITITAPGIDATVLKNAREILPTLREGHLSPRMGSLLKAFRAANGNVSQVALAKGKVGDTNLKLQTTHCQIATLEQGGCKKGAYSETVKLLAAAFGVGEDVIAKVNEADLRDRANAGDAVAKRVLGIEDAPAPEKPKAETHKPTPVDLSRTTARKAPAKAATAKSDGKVQEPVAL